MAMTEKRPQITVIELTPEEAAMFLAFREHQAAIQVLIGSGVFNIRNGSAELHFDPRGALASIDMHVKVFRQVSPTVAVLPVDKVKVVL